ncbi:MAG TPA: PfkB family carbohydrate kinase [Acidimicrobiales bacterium]|nr:PfkB family carbohydrate kinase [Acidimicrobiales bacterium]
MVVVGDTLVDRDVSGTVERVCPDAPVPVLDQDGERVRPGGAALAASLLAGEGATVTLVTALATDEAGGEVARLLAAGGVDVAALTLDGATAERVRLRSGDQSLLRLDRGGAPGPVGAPGPAVVEALAGADAIVVADYGRGVAAQPALRDQLVSLRAAVPVVWDPHPRGPQPVPGVRLATPNAAEVARLVPEAEGEGLAVLARRAAVLAARWGVTAVAVTRGAGGALLAGGDSPALVVPAPPVAGGDPCGAGDRFAGAAALALAGGAVVSEAVEVAVAAASAFVAGGGAGGWAPPEPQPAPSSAGDLAAGVRAAGGTVVATGGCFDLLHPGHVATLEAARRLGDCLIVCLNSDASVRRLKGPDRPRQPAADRAAVLRSLRSVDAVHVFDEDTPAAALGSLRPHVFVKGGDYGGAELPEAATLAAWGGCAVVVPYVSGRSTTRLLEEASRHVQP